MKMSGTTHSRANSVGGKADLRAGLEVFQKKEISYPFRESNHDSSGIQLLVYSLKKPEMTQTY